MRRLLYSFILFFTLPTIATLMLIQPASAHTQQTVCANIQATPNYLHSRKASDVIAAINYAHRRIHIRPLQLPSNFYKLPPMQQQFKLVNAERANRGLKPLQLNTTLAQMAQNYAQQMEKQHFFSHTSPAGVTFEQRFNKNASVHNHYSDIAENIAGNPIAGVGPIYEYMYNDATMGCGHRENILMPQLTHIGIGQVKDKKYGMISVQDFLASASWNPYKG